MDSDKLEWDIISSIVPFIGQETLSYLVNQSIDGKIDADRLGGLVPFLSNEDLEKLLNAALQGQINMEDCTACSLFKK